MANILNSTYQGDNYSPNSTLYEITLSLDGTVTANEISTGNYLPNNGTKFRTITGVGYIPTGSSATIYTPQEMIVANYIAEQGVVNATTGYQEGAWKVLAICPWTV